MAHIQDSPVERRRKELPKGNGDWLGYDVVYDKIQAACHVMARTRYVYLSEEHVNAMAVLGCGHEATMKLELQRLRNRGFVKLLDGRELRFSEMTPEMWNRVSSPTRS